MYPGILAMSVLYTAIFSSITIVWDRESGFLKEIQVAPLPRTAVAVNKALGGRPMDERLPPVPHLKSYEALLLECK